MFAPTPRLQLVKQPLSNVRFRYSSEGNSSASLYAEGSTKVNPKFLTVRVRIHPSYCQVIGYSGNDDIIVEASLVTHDSLKAHPHKLVGENCADGVCWANVNANTMIASFPNIRIRCVKKEQREASLKLRQQNNVDPFKRGFDHATPNAPIDINRVRLCFRLLNKHDRSPLCEPIVSNEIYQSKAVCSALVIVSLSHNSAPVSGGSQVLLLCQKINKKDIGIRFYRPTNGQDNQKYHWEAYADIISVHKQYAITFRTPPYTGPVNERNEPVKTFVQLYRPSNGKIGEPMEFQFIPIQPDYLPFASDQMDVSSTQMIPSSSSYTQQNVYTNEQLHATFHSPLYHVSSTSSSPSSSCYSSPPRDAIQNVPSSPSMPSDLSSLSLYSMDGSSAWKSDEMLEYVAEYAHDYGQQQNYGDAEVQPNRLAQYQVLDEFRSYDNGNVTNTYLQQLINSNNMDHCSSYFANGEERTL